MKAIIMVFVLAAFGLTSSDNAPSGSAIGNLDISYYWFDTCGNYIRQNTLDDEIDLTGWDNLPSPPFTLCEIGYDPKNCTGWPPVPIDPDLYDELLYSHP